MTKLELVNKAHEINDRFVAVCRLVVLNNATKGQQDVAYKRMKRELGRYGRAYLRQAGTAVTPGQMVAIYCHLVPPLKRKTVTVIVSNRRMSDGTANLYNNAVWHEIDPDGAKSGDRPHECRGHHQH